MDYFKLKMQPKEWLAGALHQTAVKTAYDASRDPLAGALDGSLILI